MKLGFAIVAALSIGQAASAAQVVRTALDAPEKAADKQDKIVCKTYPEIGSLVATQRVCRTKREWENTRANIWQRGGTGSCAGGAGENGGICQ